MRVYHLTSAQNALSNIALRRIKIARFGDLNDPFELLAAKLSDKELRQALKSWKEDFHKTKGMLCFSESWDNPVLWSHYADKHRGICLGFDIPNQYATEVNYTGKRVKVYFKNNDSEQGLSPNFVHELLCTKYEHWIYESERRMFLSLDEGTKEHGMYFYDFSDNLALKEVIIGPNCAIPYERIKQLVDNTNGSTKITKARLGFTHFEVVPNLRYEN